MIFTQTKFRAASHILTKIFHSQYSEKLMLVSPSDFRVDKRFGKNYLSFLDFAHNYKLTCEIFVPCVKWPLWVNSVMYYVMYPTIMDFYIVVFISVSMTTHYLIKLMHSFNVK